MNWEVILKLVLGMIFGGLIGLEREVGNRPAGFRTHTLVCIGSVLVMITSEYMLTAYSSYSIDPARMGAQVISGIGFLGAGTIIKDGSKVHGLTTAASLWVVACIGLAIGVGFYWGALIATLLSYATLVLLKKFGSHVPSHKYYEISLEIPNTPGQIAKVTSLLADLNICVRDIKVDSSVEKQTYAFFQVVLPPGMERLTVDAELSRLQGINLTNNKKSEEH